MSSNKPLQPHHGEIPHHEDIPATATEAFLEKNFRKIVIGAVAVIAVAAVGGLIRYKSHQTAVEAGEQLTAAKTVEDCDIIIQKYPGANAAGNALLLKADLLWKANKKDSAVAALKEFTKAYAKHPFYQSGLIGLASKLEASGEKAEAKAIYERFGSEFNKSEFTVVSQVRLADLLWADGKEDEAKKILEGLPSKHPGEMSVEMTQQRLDLIAAGLPTKEVDGPPQPKKEDKPADLKGATGTLGQPIELRPGGVQPIKLEAGLDAKGAMTPITPAPGAPDGSAGSAAPGQLKTQPVTPPSGSTAVGSKPIPAAPAPTIKADQPVQKPAVAPGSSPAPKAEVTPNKDSPASVPASPAATTPPPPPSKPVTPAPASSGEAKK